ncbi:hypothetical protein [Allokutzneria sp. NRRL B-24872]|nr:hypothetical protein [Allokutzneria sp. NRRL B-24872]
MAYWDALATPPDLTGRESTMQDQGRGDLDGATRCCGAPSGSLS